MDVCFLLPAAASCVHSVKSRTRSEVWQCSGMGAVYLQRERSSLESCGAGCDPGGVSGGEAELMATAAANAIGDGRVHACSC